MDTETFGPYKTLQNYAQDNKPLPFSSYALDFQAYLQNKVQQYQNYIKALTEFYPQDRYIIPMEIPTSKPKSLYLIILCVFVLSVFFFIFLLTNTNILR